MQVRVKSPCTIYKQHPMGNRSNIKLKWRFYPWFSISSRCKIWTWWITKSTLAKQKLREKSRFWGRLLFRFEFCGRIILPDEFFERNKQN